MFVKDKVSAISTSSVNPTVNVLFADKSCAPVGFTFTSLVVPATSMVLEVSTTEGLF